MDEDHMEEQNEEQGQKTRTGREQAKAMDKMTDHIAERELDASKAQSVRRSGVPLYWR